LISLPVVGFISAVVITVKDRKEHGEEYFKSLVEKHIKLNGIEITNNLLNKCVEEKIPLESMISLFECRC
jgi:hypothetical protein